MNKVDELMKLAGEVAYAYAENSLNSAPQEKRLREALEAALAEAQGEPVAWRVNERVNKEFVTGWNYVESEPPMQPYTVAIEPLYLHPAPAQTPLTNDEIERLTAEHDEYVTAAMRDIAERDDIIERLTAERDAFYMDYRMKCDAETKALAVERDALRKDAERYRWLRDTGDSTWMPLLERYRRAGLTFSPDAAIDAAMSPQPEPQSSPAAPDAE